MAVPISKRPLLFIIDGSSYIFRAYHALPPLTSKQGMPTNAVYGYTNMLIKTIEQYHPDYLVVVFDSKGPTFRDEIDAEYKANRGVAPDDLSVQFPLIFEITDTLAIQRLAKEGFEADDVIATLTGSASAAGFGVVIVGSDKDLMSVIGDDVVMLDTMKDQWITAADVTEKFGVSPSQMTEFLMLTGDSVDNIQGVQGIGKKTAKDLLMKYRSIDGIYEHIDEISNKRVQAALREAKEHLYSVTKGLVQLRHDVPVAADLGSFKMPASLFGSLSPDHRERLIRTFSSLEFSRLIDKLGSVDIRFDYHQVPGITEEIIGAVKHAGEASLVFMGSEAGVFADKAYYISTLTADDVKALLSVECRLIVHDAKAVHRFCIEHSIQITASLFSVELAAYLCNPESKSYSIESLARAELGEELPDLSKAADDRNNGMFGTGQGRAVYLAKAAALLSRLAPVYRERLKQDALEPLFDKIEMPLSNVLARMEHSGIRIDQSYLRGLSEKFDLKLNDLMAAMQAIVPHEFNPDSPKQVAAILFEELKLPGARKTKTGYSTDSEVLSGLSDKHPFVRLLLDYRGIAKLKNSFVDTLPSFINPGTGRIHTKFIQTGAATGRLASSNPNLQNIPVKDEQGRLIRRAFIADQGFSLISADYSQIELRIMAHLSSDEALIDAFMHDQDIHTTTASGVFQTPVPDVTPEMRSKAKVINFGIMYGMSAYGLARQLGVPAEEAQVFIDAYFSEYKGVRQYIDDIVNGVRQTGYVGTILGRRRYIPKTMDNPAYQRIAINTPVQGSAADLIKVAMLRIDDLIRRQWPDAKMLLQIHDELIFEVKDGQVDTFSAVVQEQMEGAMKLLVPLRVSISSGKTWADTL